MNTSTIKLPTDVDGLRARLPPRAAVSIYHRDGTTVLTLAPGDVCVVGRVAPADVVIPEGSLSRQHARFSFDGEAVQVMDLDSTNGTTVAGTRIEARVPVVVGVSDELVIGHVIATVTLLGRGDVRPAGLDGHEPFVVALKDELRRARHFQRPVSLLCIGSRDDDLHVSTFADDVRRLLRPVDRVAVYAPRVLEVLLAELGPGEARATADQIAARHPALVVGVASSMGSDDGADRLVALAIDAHKTARGSPSRVAVAPVEVEIPARPGAGAGTGTGEGVAGTGEVVVVNAAMQALFATLDRVAGKADRILIHGETGTGKEVIAQALRVRGKRASLPFLSVNCGGLEPTLLKSTLFGHVKGAFTGADKDKAGIFETADGGTVFLDEVGELPMEAQAALLRILENRTVTRLGGSREIPVDVCIVAATHRDLEDMCREGTFRTDLWYRLNVLTLRVPPLRQRRDEIGGLARAFLRRADTARQFSGFDDDALAALEAWDWPGNVRELKNVIDRAVLLAPGRTITLDDLEDRVRQAARRPPPPTATMKAGTATAATAPATTTTAAATTASLDRRQVVRAAERQVLLDALARHDGVKTKAAKELDIPIRTFVYRLKALGITRDPDGRYVVDDDT